jgi:PIN domain nuclease of toxin-antitoxin system
LKILIDTHIFLWALALPDRLNERQTALLQARYNTIHVSAVTIAELSIKHSIGKLTIDFDPVEMAEKTGFELLDFTAGDGLLLKGMPFHHKDPFDRMLIAQSLRNDIPVMSNDRKFQLYGCGIV